MRSSVILKNLNKIKEDYPEDSEEHLALEKAIYILEGLFNIRRRIVAAAAMHNFDQQEKR